MIYLLSFILPLLSLVSLLSENQALILLPVIYTFILIPILDLLPLKIDRDKESKATSDIVLYAASLLYLVIFSIFLVKLPHLTGSALILKSLAMGISGGVFGINCAHEFGHRINKWSVLLAKFLLFTTNYLHFIIEHNRGHHKNLATPVDPGTSRYNETIYSYLLRSTFMSWVLAFQIEKKKNGILKNKTLHYALYQSAFMAALGFIHSNLIIGFLLHSFVAIFLLASVSYVEHYGIMRKVMNGGYEKVSADHSWNSDHFFSRMYLFELTRHSDHHAKSNKPFYELESISHSPQLPTGYAGMILVAYIPSLWFNMMNPRINAYNRVNKHHLSIVAKSA